MGAKRPPNVSSPNFIWIGCRAPMITHFCLKWVSNGRPTFQLTQFCLHWMSNDHPTPNSSNFILIGCWVATYALFHLMLFNLGVKLPLDALIHEVLFELGAKRLPNIEVNQFYLNYMSNGCSTLLFTNFVWNGCQMTTQHPIIPILFKVGLGSCLTLLFTQFCLIWASGGHPMP
jgi:hypothetical protein